MDKNPYDPDVPQRRIAIVTVNIALDFSEQPVGDVKDQAADLLHDILTIQEQAYTDEGSLVDWQFADPSVRILETEDLEHYQEGAAFSKMNARLTPFTDALRAQIYRDRQERRQHGEEAARKRREAGDQQ